MASIWKGSMTAKYYLYRSIPPSSKPVSKWDPSLKKKITKFFQQLCSHGLGMKQEGNGHFLHYNYNRLLFLKSRIGARETAQQLRE